MLSAVYLATHKLDGAGCELTCTTLDSVSNVQLIQVLIQCAYRAVGLCFRWGSDWGLWRSCHNPTVFNRNYGKCQWHRKNRNRNFANISVHSVHQNRKWMQPRWLQCFWAVLYSATGNFVTIISICVGNIHGGWVQFVWRFVLFQKNQTGWLWILFFPAHCLCYSLAEKSFLWLMKIWNWLISPTEGNYSHVQFTCLAGKENIQQELCIHLVCYWLFCHHFSSMHFQVLPFSSFAKHQLLGHLCPSGDGVVCLKQV